MGYLETDLRGQRYTGNTDSTLKVRDVQPKMTLIQPYRSPFVSLLSRVGSEPTQATKFENYEDDLLGVTVLINNGGGYNTTDTTFALDTGYAARLVIDSQLLCVRTGEVVRVTGINTAADTVTVARAQGGTSAAALVDNDVLILASEAREEGISLASAVTTKATAFYNYTQEFETAVETSWIQMGTRDYTTPDFDYQILKAAAEHKEKMERAFWFGYRDLVTTGSTQGKPVFYTGGMYWFIKTNAPSANIVTLSSTPLTDVILEDWMENLLRYGNPDKKMIFTSPFGKMILGRLAKTPVRTVRSEKTLGLTITMIEILGHMIPVVEDLMFPRVGQNSLMFCIDMDNVKGRHLQSQGMNFTTKWLRNVQAPDLKGRKDVLHTCMGLHAKNEFAHGLLSGFTG